MLKYILDRVAQLYEERDLIEKYLKNSTSELLSQTLSEVLDKIDSNLDYLESFLFNI